MTRVLRWALLASSVCACAPTTIRLQVPTTGAVTAVAKLRVTVRLARHKHGQGFTLGYYEVTLEEGGATDTHTMEIVRDEDWFGEMPVGRGRVAQLLGVDSRGLVNIRIAAVPRSPPSRDEIMDRPLPEAAVALRKPGASRGNRGLHAQNGTMVLTESGGSGQPTVRVVYGELTGQVLDVRLLRTDRR